MILTNTRSTAFPKYITFWERTKEILALCLATHRFADPLSEIIDIETLNHFIEIEFN